MADKKITQLTNITGANLVDADEFVVVDISADETKAITLGELKEAFDSGSGFVRITGDTMTGDLALSGADVTFGDNDKAIFGAGSDLQIYHDGSNSYIDENGVGNLFIRSVNGASARIYSGGTASSNLRLLANSGGEITLYHTGAAKLATTSTGIDVTGTVTSDGLTVNSGSTSSNITIRNSGTSFLNIYADINGVTILDVDSGNTGGAPRFQIDVGETQAFRITEGGDISFYDSAGSSQSFFWDASAESLFIGEVSGDNLEILAGSNVPRLQFDHGGTLKGEIGYRGATAPARQNIMEVTTLSADPIAFRTFSKERMRIDSSGNVGIGTDSPQTGTSAFYDDLVIKNDASGTGAGITLQSNNTNGFGGLEFRKADGSEVAKIYASNASGHIGFNVGSEAMRIDSSGNLLVGKTALNTNTAGLQLENDGYLSACRDGGNVALINRKSSDGAIITFQKDGTTVGSIGNTGSAMYIGSDSGSDAYLLFTNNRVQPCTSTGADRDNIIDLGIGSARFDDIYATNGTIQTSDRSEKQDIEALSDAEQRVAVACKGLLRKFRWKDAVAEKGDDARIHFGIIAQDLQDAFAAEGLDAGRYAMFISSTWTDEETGEERTRMGVRYSELLAFIIAAI